MASVFLSYDRDDVEYWTKSGQWTDFCFDPYQPCDCKVEAAKHA